MQMGEAVRNRADRRRRGLDHQTGKKASEAKCSVEGGKPDPTRTGDYPRQAGSPVGIRVGYISKHKRHKSTIFSMTFSNVPISFTRNSWQARYELVKDR